MGHVWLPLTETDHSGTHLRCDHPRQASRLVQYRSSGELCIGCTWDVGDRVSQGLFDVDGRLSLEYVTAVLASDADC